ncbi:hypothetical protein KP509_06G038800 [Ceratopteris richardii]|uniref:Core Histone H2A/H2B/H3 domain-containing protein n=1 Tax=Ceratopteris richardii TaxID=49495 RepID=A0A8T2UFM7_CERRI|nr:hypothetical protein KP509_06G038800 [Ceratopteris richardii]
MTRVKKTARKLYPQEQQHGGPIPEGQPPILEGQGPALEITDSQDKVDPQKAYAKKRVKYHFKSLMEIRRAQKIVGLLIPRLPFMRVVKDISANLCSMMKKVAEDFVIDFMNDAYLCAAHCDRVTLMAKDYVVVSRLRYKG